MAWTNLGDPTPKNAPTPYELYSWRTGAVIHLPAFSSTRTSPADFFEVLRQRRTSRNFAPLQLEQLGQFLGHSSLSQNSMPSVLGFELEHRPAPSAGGIHPVHIFVKKPEDPRWWLYEPRAHFLIEITNAIESLKGLCEHRKNVQESNMATQLLLIAEPGKTFAKYDNACSLIWRDAGVLLGVMALTAQALGLVFCPLGITGEPWVSQLSNQNQLFGVGLALLGGPNLNS